MVVQPAVLITGYSHPADYHADLVLIDWIAAVKVESATLFLPNSAHTVGTEQLLFNEGTLAELRLLTKGILLYRPCWSTKIANT